VHKTVCAKPKAGVDLDLLSAQEAYTRGYEMTVCKKWQKGIAAYRACLAKAPGRIDAQSNLAMALRHIGEHDSAYEEQKKVMALLAKQRARLEDEEVYSILTNLGQTLDAVGKLQEAAAAFEEALELCPKKPDAFLHLGVAYSKLGDLRRCLEIRQRAANQFPQNALAHYNLGVSFRTMAQRAGRPGRPHPQYDAAVAAFRKAAELDPTDPDAYAQLGGCLYESGRVEPAIVELEKALELNKYHRAASQMLGFARKRAASQNVGARTR
jgi:tetratricopeptide (TPR) repeat protein